MSPSSHPERREISPVHLAAARLEAALRAKLRGDVRFDAAGRALYATDGSNYRQVPIGVVFPADVDDVIAAIALCREYDVPLLSRGAGTSLAGQTCNVAVTMDFSRHLNRILEVDATGRRARVQPGVILDHLRNAAEQHHLTFAPDPATHNRCTIGGMVGNNSCGIHSVMAGKTDENIEQLDILTYDGVRMTVGATSEVELQAIIAQGGRRGEIYAGLRQIRDRYAPLIRERFPDIPRCVSGYNLRYLLPENGFHVARALVGSEGTCVTVLEATTRLVPSPPQRALVVIAYPDIFQCGDHVPEIIAHSPIGLEGMDDYLITCQKKKGMNPSGLALLPEGGGWLLAEFGADTWQEAESKARGMMDSLARSADPPKMRLLNSNEAARVWEVRESALGAVSHVPGEPFLWEGWEDAAVAPKKLGGYLRDLQRLLQRYEYRTVLYGHFGQGCVHNRVDFDLQSAPGIAKFRRFMEDASDLVLSYGGSLSGEHGDGQARGELLPKMFGPELMQAFREFKALWDPQGRMNPGKLLDARPMDSDLRLGADYAPWQPLTVFQFPEDQGSLSEAALRCVGVGKCRREEGGLMCPSYQATREEEHSPRGRAHLLFEMLQGDVIRDGWRDEGVKHAFDLCLACKGCKTECPVNVDIATYKSEFLSHYYEGRWHPLRDYLFGNVDVLARLASLAPGLANFAASAPGLSHLAKFAAGIAPERQLPKFAPQTFKAWCRARNFASQSLQNLKPVILWPDTFNNYFHPQTAQAAVEVLEAAGFAVTVPQAHLCCGRPLYDFGMLDRAKQLLQQILSTLGRQIDAGVPVVGLEPSCVSVFRDELINLYPNDARAQSLSRQTFTLSEFLEAHAPKFRIPKTAQKAVVHGHCHHKAVLNQRNPGAQDRLLTAIGLDWTAPSEGCCGMAGPFGFERKKYDISCAIGERELLPAVRQSDADTLIIADGFSCREQIAHGAGRMVLHTAEVLQRALNPR